MDATGKSSWSGSWRKGAGTISTTSPSVQSEAYSFTSRFEEPGGTSPEELLAAAHASCFNQALANNLDMAGYEADDISSVVTVDYGISDAGLPTIYSSRIRTVARVPGMSEPEFLDRAQKAADGCTISRVLSCEISLDATLVVL